MSEIALRNEGMHSPILPHVRRCNIVSAPGSKRALWLIALLLLCAFIAAPALAQDLSLPAFSSKPAAGGGQTYTLSVQTLLMLTALSFLPSVLLLMTSFTRIIIVLSLLRHALGLQSTPSNQVLIGLSLFLTLFVMSPVLDRIYTDAYQPLAENKIGFAEALEKGAVPLQAYMLRQTRETDLALFARIANQPPLQDASQVPLKILIPAYVTSELKTAFQIGFLVFLPFMIIDMVVASVLMSMGMMMMSPATISLPFKIMLFVLADGWNLLIGSLVMSFHG
jgi:flagellar biosynthetic protein FliP